MNDESIIRVQIEAPSLADLRAFTDEIQPDFGCRPIAREVEGRVVIEAYIPESRLAAVREVRSAARVTLTTVENATTIGRERQQEVGEGNRFAAREDIPRGLGRKE